MLPTPRLAEPSNAIMFNSLATGAAVRITGVWQLAPPNKEQEYELLADNITIVGPADAEVGAFISWTSARALRNNQLTSM